MKEIETSKGRFVVVEDVRPYSIDMYVSRYGCNHYKLSEIMEEELYNETEITNSMLHFKGIEITNNTYIFKV